MKVAFFPCEGAVGYYRILLPARELDKQPGWQSSMHTTVSIDRIKGRFIEPRGCDLYVFHRWTRDNFDEIEQLPNDLKRCIGNEAMTADCDDWMPGMKASHLEGAHSVDLGGTKYIASIEGKRALFQMKLYNAVPWMSVTTRFLLEKFKGKPDREVRLVPNFLDWDLWDETDVTKEQRELRIGYYGGMQGHGKDCALLKGVIGPWLQRNPGVQFFVGGDHELQDIIGVPEDRRINGGPRQILEIPSMVREIDVGVIPLVDTPFNEAKSALKGLEMNACGIPVIASPLPSYLEWIEPGVNGFIAKRPKDWLKYLDVLRDERVRKEMGRNAKEKAYEHRIQAPENIGQWESFYSEATASII